MTVSTSLPALKMDAVYKFEVDVKAGSPVARLFNHCATEVYDPTLTNTGTPEEVYLNAIRTFLSMGAKVKKLQAKNAGEETFMFKVEGREIVGLQIQDLTAYTNPQKHPNSGITGMRFYEVSDSELSGNTLIRSARFGQPVPA